MYGEGEKEYTKFVSVLLSDEAGKFQQCRNDQNVFDDGGAESCSGILGE